MLTGISTSSKNYDGDGSLDKPLGCRHCTEVGDMVPTLSITTLRVLQRARYLPSSPPCKGEGQRGGTRCQRPLAPLQPSRSN